MSTVPTTSPHRTALDVSLLVVRVIGGLIMAAHGSQKLFGAFGGPGMEKLVPMMQEQGLPPAVTWLVAIGEFFGGVGLILGFLTRFSAAANILIMLGAIALVHGKNGLFLQNQGFEYNLALIGLFVPVLLLGPGRYALGRILPLPGTVVLE